MYFCISVLYFCVFVLLHFCQSTCETCCQQKIAPVQKFSTSAKFLRHIHPSPAKVSVNSSSTAVKLHVDCFKCQSNAMVMMMILKDDDDDDDKGRGMSKK